MKIYIVKRFYSNGWIESHEDIGMFSTQEKAKKFFDNLGLSFVYKRDGSVDTLWGDYIEEKEIP